MGLIEPDAPRATRIDWLALLVAVAVSALVCSCTGDSERDANANSVGSGEVGEVGEEVAAISQAYCDLFYDCGVRAGDWIGRCALFRDEIAAVWEDPECFALCIEATTCEQLESSASDAWSSCGCERAGAVEACEKAAECSLLGTSKDACIADPAVALDVPEKKVPCVAACYQEHACGEIPVECNDLRPGTPCYTNPDDVPEPDVMIPPCTPGETVPTTDITGCSQRGLEPVLVCQSDGKFRVNECREPTSPAQAGMGGGSRAGGAGGVGAVADAGMRRGTSVCQTWQDAMCDWFVDTCGAASRQQCEYEFWSLECQSDELAGACSDALTLHADCVLPPPECDDREIIDASPAVAKCETFEKEACEVIVRCGAANSVETCREELIDGSSLTCGDAIGATPGYEACLDELTNVACVDLESVLAECAQTILARPGWGDGP